MNNRSRYRNSNVNASAVLPRLSRPQTLVNLTLLGTRTRPVHRFACDRGTSILRSRRRVYLGLRPPHCLCVPLPPPESYGAAPRSRKRCQGELRMKLLRLLNFGHRPSLHPIVSLPRLNQKNGKALYLNPLRTYHPFIRGRLLSKIPRTTSSSFRVLSRRRKEGRLL